MAEKQICFSFLFIMLVSEFPLLGLSGEMTAVTEMGAMLKDSEWILHISGFVFMMYCLP